MKIRIHKENEGYSVLRQINGHWLHWLPEPWIDQRGDEVYDYYRTVTMAKKAAIKAKAEEEKDKDVELEI